METELQRKCKTCPQNGEPCVDGFRPDFKPHTDGKIYACRWWTAVKGKDPQSETILDFYDCSVPWMPVIGIEQSQMTRQNTATMQDFRNEMNDSVKKIGTGMHQAALAFNQLVETQRELIGGVPLPAIENKENNGHEQ